MVRSQKGQILLIVILVMIVALTVGLSIASRTITNIRIARQSEESQRAFQAAEAGIDQALNRIPPPGAQGPDTIEDSFGNNSSFTTELESVEGSSILVNGGEVVQQGVGADVWLSQYSDDPGQIYSSPLGDPNPVNMYIYWGTNDQIDCEINNRNTLPALEVLMLTGATANPTYQKLLFEPSGPSGCGRITDATAVSAGVNTISGVTFNYRTGPIPISQGRIMKIIPIYNSGVIGISVDGGVEFPSQGSLITSTGISGDVKREITLFSSYPQIPLEIFPYNIISQ